MQASGPIFEKEVINQNQLAGVSLSQITIAKDSKYGWYVQAVNREGKAFGGTNGMSEILVFGVKSEAVNITNFKLDCGTGVGNYNFTLTAQNIGTYPFSTQNIQLNPAALVSLQTTSPPLLPSSPLIPVLGSLTFTGSFHYSGSYPNQIYATISGFPSNDPLMTASSSEMDIINSCYCTDCDYLEWSFDLGANQVSNNQYNLIGSLSVVQADGSNLPIYKVVFQVLSYAYTPDPVACSNGITSLEESGMLLIPSTSINGTTAIGIDNESISSDPNSNNHASKSVSLSGSNPFPASIPVILTMGLPGALPGLAQDCCKVDYSVCIEITVFYDAIVCKSCTYIKCIEFSNQ